MSGGQELVEKLNTTDLINSKSAKQGLEDIKLLLRSIIIIVLFFLSYFVVFKNHSIRFGQIRFKFYICL